MSDSPPYQQLTEDIYQVHIPLPFALNRVNCYLIRGDEGWTIVDTGLNLPEARGVWLRVFKALDVASTQIRQIVLTHVHPDHFGLAGWLQQHCRTDNGGATPPVYMSPREAQLASEFWGAPDGSWDRLLMNFWRACGVTAEMAVDLTTSTSETRQRTFPHPTEIKLIKPGSQVQLGDRDFQAIHMPGHSDGQLIFYDAADQLLLSGDHVLMKITPNIGLWPHGELDPLNLYLASLEQLSQLTVRLALPGHKTIITDLAGRIAELQDHHVARLELTMAAANSGANVYEVSRHLFPFDVLSVHERRFALAETLAHLEYLRRRDCLQRDDGTTWVYCKR
jgi:glyoxylase-like metal-dependent hydrolase (beta-lactamase superfamily II)